MAFIAVLVKTLIKMIIIAAVSFGGILLGKNLRKKKDEKDDE